MGETTPSDQLDARRHRLRRLAAVTSVAGAVLLALGAVRSEAQPEPPPTLVLEQLLDGQVECVSPEAQCLLNLYSQGGAPGPSFITPGEQHVTTVDLRNAGNLTASSLEMAAGTCRNEDTSGVGTPDGDLCGTVTVAVLCTSGATTFSYGPTTLPEFAESGTHTIVGGLAPGAAARCTFTVGYPADAPYFFFTRAVQPVTWTMTAAEVPPTTPPTTTAPTTGPPTTAPPPTASPTTGPPSVAPPGPPARPAVPAAPAPGATPRQPGALAFTGGDALPLALAGLALLLIGGLLYWWSRPREHRWTGEPGAVE